MPKVIFEETESRKITKAEAMEWIEAQAGVDLRIAGSLLNRDFSYNDVDLTLHTHPCKGIVERLLSATFPIQIFCRVCGAVMNYNPTTDTWTWRYSARIAERTLAFPLGEVGTSAEALHSMNTRLKALEKRSARQ